MTEQQLSLHTALLRAAQEYTQAAMQLACGYPENARRCMQAGDDWLSGARDAIATEGEQLKETGTWAEKSKPTPKNSAASSAADR